MIYHEIVDQSPFMSTNTNNQGSRTVLKCRNNL